MVKRARTTHLRSGRPWWSVDWHEIYQYRDLLWLLVKRDFTAIYKQSILGPLWFIIQPLATTIVFTVVFGKIADIETSNEIPHFIIYMCSMVYWNYFQGAMTGVSNSLIANAGVFGKVYFPRLIAPLSLIVSNLGQFALSMLTFLGFYMYYLFALETNIQPSLWLLALPLTVIYAAAVSLGVGLWFAALTAKYRDLRFALPFLSQLWMFATPIIYQASNVSADKQWLLALNPVAGLIEFVKFSFLGVGVVDFVFLGTGVAVTLFLLASGFFVFCRIERTFVDSI